MRFKGWRGAAGVTLLAALAPALAALAAEPRRIPLRVDKPAGVNVTSWPLTFGLPLTQGLCRDAALLGIVNEKNEPVAAEMTKVGDWPDGSLRWVHADFTAEFPGRYFVTIAAGADGQTRVPLLPRPDDVRVEQNDAGLAVVTGGARYFFPAGGGCFDTVHLDGNRDGAFADDETLVRGAAAGFYLVDSLGRRGLFAGGAMTLAHAGRRRVVVRIKGEYRTADGQRNAAAIAYFHFFAGFPLVRISHKLIVTEETNRLWFRDIGLSLPVAAGDKPAAAFNTAHNNPALFSLRRFTAQEEYVMAQETFPHFGRTESRFGLRRYREGEAVQLEAGAACGDWANLSSAKWGLAAQLPAFAEQFPKAFRVASDRLTVKFWAAEAGRDLDFRTESVIRDYFGYDWIHPDHAVTKIANTAQGTAKTHDLWLYPHLGAADKKLPERLGATRDEIYAVVDPAWLMASGAFGPLHERDPRRFPETEAAIEDYFQRTTLASQRVFPATGYLAWGIYPYGSAQGWRQRPENGNRWYPDIHRHSRCLEYNFKRAVWLLYARSGERPYRDYARKYTRFLGDFIQSNCDAACKPEGWFVQGEFHSPCCWGAFGEQAIALGVAGRKASWNGEASFLSVASSEDVIQFVYDWFLSGEFHARDAARRYIDAVVAESGLDPEKAVFAGGGRPDAFVRMIGSMYELDHDPRLRAFGEKYVRRLILPDGSVNPEFPATLQVKWGEYYGALLYYYFATGDELAKKALLRRAEFEYRHGLEQGFFSRSSPLLSAFALLFRETGNPIYAQYLGQTLRDYGRNGRVLDRLGLKLADLNQQTTVFWGQDILTGNGPINVGLPAAMAALAAWDGPLPALPYARKPEPTERTHLLLRKDTPAAALLDVFVNNWGDRAVTPRLLTLAGAAQPLETVARDFRRIQQIDWDRSDTEWLYRYEDLAFYRLRVPAGVAPGVYELDLGDEVNFTLLDSGLPKAMQVAPEGAVVEPGGRHWFLLPEGVESVEFFAARPVRIFDPAGREAACDDLQNGRFRFVAGGVGGKWALECGTDKYAAPGSAGVISFVRLEKVRQGGADMAWPLVIASGDPDRLFGADLSRFRRTRPADPPKPDPAQAFVPLASRAAFGQGMNLAEHYVEVTLPETAQANAPHERGTVEFWFQPQWSATDAQFFTSYGNYQQLQCFQAGPVSLQYLLNSDTGGRQGYLVAYVEAAVGKVGSTRARVFLQAGKWYHVAFTWNVDGRDSKCFLYLNGRQRAHAHYYRGMTPDAAPEKLAARARTVRFGSGRGPGRVATSEIYDELRLSRSIRYDRDFEPPTAPFAPDADTFLLLHCDGEGGVLDGQPLPAPPLKRGRMW